MSEINPTGVKVDTSWTPNEEQDVPELGTHMLRIHVEGLTLDGSPCVDVGGVITHDWFAITIDEARDLYFGLGVMLGEYDEAEFGQS